MQVVISDHIIRLCANTGFHLHLIEPLGFDLDDKKLRRAGLDYHEWAQVELYPSVAAFVEQVQPKNLYACSTKGSRGHCDPHYQAGDALLFGPETRGLPDSLLSTLSSEHILKLPMQPDSRSLNLSNSVAIFVYEAWRQLGFEGSA